MEVAAQDILHYVLGALSHYNCIVPSCEMCRVECQNLHCNGFPYIYLLVISGFYMHVKHPPCSEKPFPAMCYGFVC